MLLLYAIGLGLLAGRLMGGRLAPISDVRFSWWPLALGGLAFQVLLFAPPLAITVGDAGPALYVASTIAVLAVILRNVSLPGMTVMTAGAICNLAAVVANGGQMPADPAAVMSLTGGALLGSDGFSNSTSVGPGTVLGFLGDNMVLPRPIPLANVFSAGDVLIGLGAVLFLVSVMRRPPSRQAPRPLRDVPRASVAS